MRPRTPGSGIFASRTSGSPSACAAVIRTRPANPATRSRSSLLLAVLPIESRGVLPVDDLHESVDVSRGFCAVIHVIGVLVHVEREDRPAAREIGRVVGRP